MINSLMTWIRCSR